MILNLLARTAHEFGVALLMATHSGESAAFVDRVLRMRDGMLESADVLL